MSAPQPLQQRVLEVLEAQGSVPAKDMGRWLKDVDGIALDCALNALLRSSKITRELGRYDLVRAAPRARDQRGENKSASIAEAVSTAALEAASSLQPPNRWICKSCKAPQPICEFRLIGSGGLRAKECNTCHGKKAQAGLKKRRGQRSTGLVNGVEALMVGQQTVNLPGTSPIAGSSPANSTTSKSPQREGDNRDVSTEHAQKAAAVPETSGSYSRSDPSEDARTPASPESASPVFELVTLQRQSGLNKIALLEAELANALAYVAERERFLELYAKFAEGAG